MAPSEHITSAGASENDPRHPNGAIPLTLPLDRCPSVRASNRPSPPGRRNDYCAVVDAGRGASGFGATCFGRVGLGACFGVIGIPAAGWSEAGWAPAGDADAGRATAGRGAA